MEPFPTFPSNKRHAMHFRHQPSTDEVITARFPNPKVGHLSPSNVSISTYHTPDSLEEALALAATSPQSPAHHAKNVSQSRKPLQRSESSNWWMEIRKSPSPTKQEPRSRKTSHATIRTDATETQPAFESDALMPMPTTREPILDPSVFRAKLPSPTRAQVEAHQIYKQKAQQVRENNHKDGVRVPSKIVSYDYTSTIATGRPQSSGLDLSPPSSPPSFSSAGAFPVSSPAPQHTWTKPRQHVHVQGPRSISDSSNISIARKPVGLGNIKSNDRRVYQRGDVDAGASRPTPSSTPDKVKVRIKPKTQDPDRPQKESWWGLYNRSPQSSADGSRSPSPTKPNFAYTSSTDTVFGYTSNDISGTPATSAKSKAATKTTPKRAVTSRWAWLRPTGPRVNKPTATHTNAMAYTDPFIQHATPVPTHPNTPTASRPASPKKLVRTYPPSEAVAKGKFETGFAQVTSLGALIVKVCLIIYALVGLYFLLDAIREAIHTLGAPFRVIRLLGWYVWAGTAWVMGVAGKGWERWGVKVALKGGWRGRWCQW